VRNLVVKYVVHSQVYAERFHPANRCFVSRTIAVIDPPNAADCHQENQPEQVSQREFHARHSTRARKCLVGATGL